MIHLLSIPDSISDFDSFGNKLARVASEAHKIRERIVIGT
jgi:hypothetical protein